MSPRSQFAGILDHVFVSSGEPGSILSISGVLGFPKGADVAFIEQEATDNDSSHGDNGETREVHGDGSEEMFGPIPDKIWGSDHLALGVELTLGC